MRPRLVWLLITAATLSGCAVPVKSSVGRSAAPALVPEDGPLFQTAEEAALASAVADAGSAAKDLRAEVVFRQPSVPTSVRVKTSSPDYCAVWAPVFDEEREGWVAFGQPSRC